MKRLLVEDRTFVEHDQWYWPVGAAVLAVFVAVGVVIQRGALVPPSWPALWAGLAVAPWLVDAVVYPLKRVGVPVWLFVPVVIGSVVALMLDHSHDDLAPFLLVLLCAEMASRLVVAGGLAVFLASLASVLAVGVWGPREDWFVWLIGVTLGWAGGFAVRTQLRLTMQMKKAHETRAARAVAEERARIAREIHDVVAHTLSVTMLHLTGARLALERGDRDEATAALVEAEGAGRESLADIRATVNVLAGGQTGTDAPMPTACDVSELVEGFRAAGLEIDLEVRGDPLAVPAATGLAVYRIAQESLANVVKHAPGAAATVCLTVDDRVGVRLEVADSGNGAAPAPTGEGRGLEGMKERAELLGGTVEAGHSERGWVVEATLPGPDTPKGWGCG